MKPTAAEAEVLTLRAIVGAYLDNRRGTAQLLDETELKTEDFTSEQTQALYAALAQAMREGKPIDLLALCTGLRGRVDSKLISEVTFGEDALVNPGLAKSRIEALLDSGRRRALRDSLRRIAELLSTDITTDTCVSELETITSEASEKSRGGLRTLDGSLMSLVDKLQAVQAGTRETTLASGIAALDYVIGGLQPTLTIVGALPGVGKSALFSAFARNLAKRGLRVGVLSLEDERDWLAERLLAEAASVPLFVLGNKPLTTPQMQRIDETINTTHATLQNIYVDDTPGMSPADVVASARAMVARGCRAVLVDHLGEIRLNRTERHDLDIQEALQDLRSIAKTYRVPVVVACHLRRREGLNVDTAPRLTDFAFSAAIERCARVALGLFKVATKDHEQPVMGVAVLKQTKGPADFGFRLNVGRLSGTVVDTPVTDAMRSEFGSWRDA
ncbi:MAG: AAA family ATPase [Archangiaceae bacterium]|nr:AAA family ATPase [Archangiaceae bacterium]MBK7865252.1 AAA family ATPase [Archangiaceae bacterium]